MMWKRLVVRGVDCVVMSYGYNHGEDISACQPQQVIDTLEALIV